VAGEDAESPGEKIGDEAAGDAVFDEADQPAFDTSVAHIARVYDYWLGGKDNFAADREAAQQAVAAYPDMPSSVRANRAFLARAVRYVAREGGIRQFLDIGTGIPTANNTHEVAQAAAPESRVVYVDNDPVVLAHARALLTSSPEGATHYIDSDLRDTGRILAEAAQTLDLSRPVGVMLIAVLHLISDEDDPGAIITRLLDAVPPGSYLILSHVASDIQQEQMADLRDRMNRLVYQQSWYRSQSEVTRLFDHLDLVEPGVVPAPRWRPDSELEAARAAAMWGGVGRKA
jgi:S-adenosyl methyltransferase